MSTLACQCGGIISDSVCPSRTEALLLRQQDEEQLYRDVGRDVAEFFGSAADGRAAWLQSYFTPDYPADMSNEDVVEDILTLQMGRQVLSVCECPTCGRLHIQRGNDENVYVSFSPDDPAVRHTLRSTQSDRR